MRLRCLDTKKQPVRISILGGLLRFERGNSLKITMKYGEKTYRTECCDEAISLPHPTLIQKLLRRSVERYCPKCGEVVTIRC